MTRQRGVFKFIFRFNTYANYRLLFFHSHLIKRLYKQWKKRLLSNGIDSLVSIARSFFPFHASNFHHWKLYFLLTSHHRKQRRLGEFIKYFVLIFQATCDVWTRWPHHGVYTYLAGLSKSNQEKSTKKATAEEGKLSLLVISHLSSSPSEYAKGLQEVYHRVRDCVVVQ